VSAGRITQSMTARMLLSDLQNVAERLSQTQQRIASGKRITVPSDDPFGTSRALQLRSDLEENRQCQRNVSEASSWQSVTDTTLGQIGDFALRARDLVVQAASDTSGQAARSAIANEIDQIVKAIKGEANAQYGGRYILAGTKTTTAPYSQTTDAYAGDTGTVVREIGKGVQVAVNVTGAAVVGDWNGTTGTGLIGVLRTIQNDLQSGNTAALGNDLSSLDAAHDALVAARAQSGALANRLDAAQSRLGQVEETTTKLLSDTEDADMAKTLVDYSTQQAVYQAALKAGAQLIQPSLLDYLQ
jgi:flagellar hook-associated protein 3 FlgL